MLVAAVLVMILSIAAMFFYVISVADISLSEPFSRRIIEGAVIAVVIAGALTLLLSYLISRNLELTKLREKDETLAAILDNLNEGVLATNLDGQVVFANPIARDLLGMDSSEKVQNPEVLQELPCPWDDFDLPAAVKRCANEWECVTSMARDGETFLRVNLEHMPAFDDHKGGVLVVLQDLSEGRRLEANQQRFLTNAAHELRTPLSNIALAAELLSTGAAEDAGARKRFLDHILSATHRMQRLSETLLRLARIGWERREPVIEPVNPAEVARAAAESMQPLAESTGVSVDIEGEGLPVLADATMLEQALITLVSNAVKNSEKGEKITLRLDGPNVLVEDTGKGISPDELPYVFERFYRSKEGSGGFGLGLSICKDIVERMNGEISIDSEPGAGTSVRIQLREAGG